MKIENLYSGERDYLLNFYYGKIEGWYHVMNIFDRRKREGRLENESQGIEFIKLWVENFRLRTQFLTKIFLKITVVLLILDICWIGWITINYENSKKTYIPVIGKIVDANLEPVYSKREHLIGQIRTLKAEYVVDGITYTTTDRKEKRFNSINQVNFYSTKEYEVKKLIGTEVEVYYNPNNPNETNGSLLAFRISGIIFWGVIALLLLLLILYLRHNIIKVDKIREQRELEGGDTRGELLPLKLSNIKKEDWEKEIEQTLLKKEKSTKIFLAVLIFVVVPILCWNIVDYHVKTKDFVPITGEIVDLKEYYSNTHDNDTRQYVMTSVL